MFDNFDVNDAYAAVVTADSKYAFVAGFNGKGFGRGGKLNKRAYPHSIVLLASLYRRASPPFTAEIGCNDFIKAL